MTLLAGRYTLLQKLAAGGMAEVFLARQQGLEGFEKLVVLKRILPHHSTNPEFVRMFLDEARTAADLSHPNLVTIFDVGHAENAWFITMEYLRGKDLGAIHTEAKRSARTLPLSAKLHMVIDAARGLHAAHTKKNLDGRELRIVHRDISPQNLFATWDGVTKVLDFGIARAATRPDSTQIGVVKGKIAYMSPEQLEGTELDGRADQFALGIVAWELLTGSRLFHKPSDAEILRALLEHRVPKPSSVDPSIPEPVEEIVLKMLAERRDDRFATCALAADAFEAWLDSTHTPHSAARTAGALKDFFPDPNAPAAAAAAVTLPGVEPAAKLKRDVTTRTDRKRPSLPQEEDFLSAVSDFLHERPERRKSNLVPPAGPFIGREKELASLESSFSEGARLVTLVGFGGVGKTRLAQELAWRQRDQWARTGGTWVCYLSDARSIADVCKLVARAVDVDVSPEAGPDDSVTQAGRTLKSLGRALVVLDNFEQIVEAGPQTIGRWLEQAPDIRFLVTSRESLRLPNEVVYPLAPLATQGGRASEAVQLFIARAQLAGRSPTEAELSVVASICARLEGHALAIELAAAQVSHLSPQEIDERLQQRFGVLGAPKPSEDRHATLWNTIDWSWQLLSAPEQAALAQLSVFRGGCTPESAVAVIDLTAFPLAPTRLDVVASLHRKSLLCHFVTPECPGVLRLKMLESVHQFATLKLEEAGASSSATIAARLRHAAHYLEVGQLDLAQLGTSNTEEAMAQLLAERENLAEIFERSLATLPPTASSARNALQALQVLEPVMLRAGTSSSQLALLDESLRVARTIGVDAGTLSIGLQQRGNACRVRGRLAQAVDDLEQALAIARTTNSNGLIARVANDLAVARFVSGNVDQALAGFEEALLLATSVGDIAAQIEAHAYLAIVCEARNEPSEAIAHCDQALPLARDRGDRLNEARVLGTMGSIFQDQARLELASAFLREAIERCRAIREARLQGYFLGKLAHILIERGQYEKARASLGDALTLLRDVGDLRHEGLFLSYLGGLDALEREHERARVTLGSAKLRLDSVKDPLLLTALALRSMEVEVRAAAASRSEAQALLDDVAAARGSRRARIDQSEEVRLAARSLARAMNPL